MNSFRSRRVLFGSALGILSLSIALYVAAQGTLTNQSKLSIDGIGNVRVGMTVSEASREADIPLVPLGNGKINTEASCLYVKPKMGVQGLELMLVKGRIARIDVLKNSPITTQSGAKLGDSEVRIKSLYPGIKVLGHRYIPQGHYLTFVPKDARDRNYRIVFETDGRKVTYIRAGKLPEVGFVERCG
jgi:hypothetical protein